MSVSTRTTVTLHADGVTATLDNGRLVSIHIDKQHMEEEDFTAGDMIDRLEDRANEMLMLVAELRGRIPIAPGRPTDRYEIPEELLYAWRNFTCPEYLSSAIDPDGFTATPENADEIFRRLRELMTDDNGVPL